MIALPISCSHCGAVNRPGSGWCRTCKRSLYNPGSMTNIAVPQYQLLRQHYRIVRPVGMGGMGVVYEAVDILHNRRVAVKAMRSSGLSGEQVLKATVAFSNEARMLIRLQHPHLPKAYDYFAESGYCYLVMEFIEGVTLDHYLRTMPGRRLPVTQVLAIGKHLCSVFEYLHTQSNPIIFRDLKPTNIMSTSGGKLFLIDFGIARHFKPGGIRDTMVYGTAGYAAPEQYGQRQTTPRADIYSLGVVLYQLLTGNDPTIRPFLFPFPHPRDCAFPLELAQLIMCMVQLDENKRPASAALVKQVLQRIDSRLTRVCCLRR